MDLDDRLRKTPRQARSRNTVEAILEAAERVLRTEGYSAASTNRVARVAGFSVGSLYQYFDDKQAVVGTLLDQALKAEAERIAQALDSAARLAPAAARERLVRLLLSERRGKSHLLRILDGHGAELCAEPPLQHVLRVQAGPLADSLHRFAAAHFSDVFRGSFDEGLAVTARFAHALSYALAVDSPEHLADEAVAQLTVATLGALQRPPVALAPAARDLSAAWSAGGGTAWADPASRARRVREARSALMRHEGLPSASLETVVFVAAAIGEAYAELRDVLPRGLDAARVHDATARLLTACLTAASS